MSNNSKVFVTVGKEKAIDVGREVQKAIHKLVNDYNKGKIESTGLYNIYQYNNMIDDIGDINKKLTMYVNISSYDFNNFSFVFGYDDSQRRVFMTTDCGCDHKDVDPSDDKISFLIGNWGSDEIIIKTIAEAIKKFGNTYYVINDNDENEWTKV